MRLLTVGVCLAVSLLLIALGTPRVVASFLKAPAFGTLLQARADRPLDPDSLQTAIAYLQRATDWERSGALYGDLGLLLYRDALRRAADDPLKPARAIESIAAIEQSLARTPTVPQDWIRLAYAKTLVDGPGPAVAETIGRSLRLAPFSGALAPAQIDLLLQNWADLPPAARKDAGALIRFGWRHHARELTDIAAKRDRLEVLRLALRSDREAVQQIDNALSRSNP